MAGKTIDFIFDFGSPNAYLALPPLRDVAGKHGAEINLVPCLLGGIFKATGNQAPMMANAGIKGKNEYMMLEMRRFIEKHGFTRFAMNPHFPVNTLLAMRAMVAARHRGEEAAYVDAVLKAMWEDGEKMDDAQVFVAVLDRAGLDGAALAEAAQDQAVKDELAANTAEAVERGAFGIPTFFIGSEMFFGKDRIEQIDEWLQESA